MEASVNVDEVSQWQYYNEFNPLYLNYICILNGYYPVQIDRRFNYCELGCGVGVTLNGLAELYPEAKFFGIDSNLNYIDAAVALSKGIESPNIDFHCLGYNELAKAALPDFDFIILHDVYSWIDEDARSHIQDFIANHLRKDGILYLDYEAMPGGSVISPLREIVSFHTSGMKADNLIKAQSGLDYLEFMNTNDVSCFANNPAAKSFFDDIKTKEINYAAHRLLSDYFKPYYFHQIEKEMQKIGLSFAGSAICHLNFIDLAVPLDFQEFLKNVATRELFESHGDLIRNQFLRKDVFVNSRELMDAQEQTEILSRVMFGMTCSEDEFELVVEFENVELNYNVDIFRRLIRILAKNSNSARNLIQNNELKDYSIELVVDALKFLSSSGRILPFSITSDKNDKLNMEADRYSISSKSNIQFLKNRLFKQDKITLLGPKAGIGVEFTMSDALFILCTAEASRGEVVDWILQRLAEANQEVLTDGASEKETMQLGYQEFCKNHLPKLLQFGVLEAEDN